LTGAGRDINDLTGLLRRVYFDDGVSPAPEALVDWKLSFSSYTAPTQVAIDVDFTNATAGVRKFQDFTLDLSGLQYQDDSGSTVTLSTIQNIPRTFQGLANINVYPGRRTGVSIFLDPTMFSTTVDATAGTIGVFDPARFRAVNIPSDLDKSKIQGFFDDYVSFDIVNMADADKPVLNSGGVADRVFFSGDGYAIAAGEIGGTYEALTTDTFTPITGNYSAPSILNGRQIPGTYSLQQTNPSDLSQDSKIISLVGIWKEHTQVLDNMKAKELIAFPSTADDNIQDVVLVTQTVTTGASATQYSVTGLLFGYIEYNFDSGSNTINLFAVKDLPNGIGASAVLTGTVTNLLDANGSAAKIASQVRSATYTLSDGTKGTLVVFRK
jgi:hypothetical protein